MARVRLDPGHPIPLYSELLILPPTVHVLHTVTVFLYCEFNAIFFHVSLYYSFSIHSPLTTHHPPLTSTTHHSPLTSTIHQHNLPAQPTTYHSPAQPTSTTHHPPLTSTTHHSPLTSTTHHSPLTSTTHQHNPPPTTHHSSAQPTTHHSPAQPATHHSPAQSTSPTHHPPLTSITTDDVSFLSHTLITFHWHSSEVVTSYYYATINPAWLFNVCAEHNTPIVYNPYIIDSVFRTISSW